MQKERYIHLFFLSTFNVRSFLSFDSLLGTGIQQAQQAEVPFLSCLLLLQLCSLSCHSKDRKTEVSKVQWEHGRQGWGQWCHIFVFKRRSRFRHAALPRLSHLLGRVFFHQ